MQDIDDESLKAVFGEVLLDHLKAIRESLSDLPAIKQKVESTDKRLAAVESDVRVIRAAVTDQSHEIRTYGERLDSLETA